MINLVQKHLALLIIFVIKASATTSNVDDYYQEIKIIPPANFYNLNDSIIIRCRARVLKKLVNLFRNELGMQAENCTIYNQKYFIKCRSEDLTDLVRVVYYDFHIPHVEWSDRGNWSCLFGQKLTKIYLEIHVPPKIQKLQVAAIKPKFTHPSSSNQIHSSASSSSDTTYSITGRGSRTNPYNLRNGSALNVTCSTTCSYPPFDIIWRYSNGTARGNLETSHNTLQSECAKDNKGMSRSVNSIEINCTSMKLVGANEIKCDKSTDFLKITSVYVLCPGGDRPWELTTGEVVGLILSGVIFGLLVLLLCLLVRKKNSPMYETAPGSSTQMFVPPAEPSISVGNFSSGVRV